jgi:uncharacterized FAD-dependent dehydrogenase
MNMMLERSLLNTISVLGIELILGTKVISADVRRKTLVTVAGETISYKTLIIAIGARVLDLLHFFFVYFFISRWFCRCCLIFSFAAFHLST